MPWVLSHVCRLWRNVALSTSAPWSRLYIDDTSGRDYPFAPELLQTYLDRSKEIPLSVTVNSSNNIDDIRERLTPHQSRLHTLELNLCLPGLKALSVLVANFPKLTILRLSVEGTNIGDAGELVLGLDQEAVLHAISQALAPPVDAFLHAHLLKDVYLEGIGISHVGVPLKRLTRFTGDIFRVEDYILLFKDGLELAEVELWMRCPIELSHFPLPSSGPLWHTRLSRLSLYTDTSCLRFIRLPALQHFRIEGRKDNTEVTSFEMSSDIDLFLRESQCPLETLLLEIPPLHDTSLSSILEACATTLTTLSLRVDVVEARDIYDALAFDGVTCLAPRVDNLALRDDSFSFEGKGEGEGIDWSFHNSFHGDSLFTMVQSRCSLSWDRGISRLRFLTLCAPYSSRPTEALERLAELQREDLVVEFHGYSRVTRFSPETRLRKE